jgi:MFS family permease
MFQLFAVLPIFVVQELHGLQSQVGLVMGIFAVSAVLARPASGRIVEVWNRKAGLSLGALIYFIAPALYTLAHSVFAMLVLRFVHGIGIAIYTTAGAVLAADFCPPARRGEGMGYYGMAMMLAMTIGPAFGAAMIGPIGFHGLFWVSSGLGLVSLVLARIVHEPERAHTRAQDAAERPPLFSRAALGPGFVAMCMTMTFGSIVSFLPLFVRDLQLGNPGVYFTIYAVVVLFSRPISGKLSDRLGRAAIIIPGMGLLACSMLTLAHSTSLFGLTCSAILQGLGFGGVQPALMALVVDRSTIRDRGPALATLMGAFDVGVSLSAIGLGQVLERTNFTTMYTCAAGVAVLGGGVFAVRTLQQRRA